MKETDNKIKTDDLFNKDKLIEANKEILSMIEYMKSKWTYGLVELINYFEYIDYGDDFMSELKEFLLMVEGTLIEDEEFTVNIKGETFIESGLKGFRYFTENASFKFAYSFDEEPPLCINKPYLMRIEWMRMYYNIGL